MRRSTPLLGLLFGVGLIGIAELACRLLAPADSAGQQDIALVPHPTRIWALGQLGAAPEHRPAYALDERGMRAPAKSGTPHGPLILTLGDSSIFGDGLADGETLHDQLQSRLAGSSMAPRVRTAAVPGYSMVQTTVLMDEVGWALAPDLLIIGSLWSDCSQDQWRDEELLELMTAPTARVERGLAYSALFTTLRRTVNSALGRPTSWRITWPRPGDRGRRRVPVDRYAQLLDGLLDQAAERDVGVALLTLANRDDIASPNPKAGCAPYTDVQRILAKKRGLVQVDSQVAYRASGRSTDELLWDGLHPSALGAQVLATATAVALSDAGWPQQRLVPGPRQAFELPDDPSDGKGLVHPASVQREMAGQ